MTTGINYPNADSRLRETLASLPTRAEQKAYVSGRYDALLLMQQLNPETGSAVELAPKQPLTLKQQRLAVFDAFIASGGGILSCRANGTCAPLCKCCGEPLEGGVTECEDCG